MHLGSKITRLVFPKKIGGMTVKALSAIYILLQTGGPFNHIDGKDNGLQLNQSVFKTEKYLLVKKAFHRYNYWALLSCTYTVQQWIPMD